MDYETSTLSWEEKELLKAYGTQDDSNEATVLFIKNCIPIILDLVICIFVLANNAFLIFAILKFKRQTKTNYIIVNLVVVNSIATIANTIKSIAMAVQSIRIILHLLIFVMVLLNLCLQITFILAAYLCLDWFIVANFKNFGLKYQNVYKWLIGLCYALPILFFIYIFVAGYHFLDGAILFMYLTYLGGGIINLLVNVTKYCKTFNDTALNTSHGVTVSNIYYLMWTISFTIQCLTFVALLAPIVMTFALSRGDKHFKMSYDAIFKRSVRAYRSAENTTEEENNC